MKEVILSIVPEVMEESSPIRPVSESPSISRSLYCSMVSLTFDSCVRYTMSESFTLAGTIRNMMTAIRAIFKAVLRKSLLPLITAKPRMTQARGIRHMNEMYPERVMRNFSRYRALRIRRKYLASSASCSASGVQISPGRRERVAEVAAAPPERVITDAILSSVCSIECL